MVGGLQTKIRCLRCGGRAALEVESRATTVANTPNEQDPLAKRKINCHRTDLMAKDNHLVESWLSCSGEVSFDK
jgi:hypothetical protein